MAMTDATVIDGKAFSEKLVQQVADEVKLFEKATGTVPGLAVVLVGEDPASKVYVRNKVSEPPPLGCAQSSTA